MAPRWMLTLSLLGSLAVSVGCGELPCDRFPQLPEADVLFMGDSILATGKSSCWSIADTVTRQRRVQSRTVAIGGAELLRGDAKIDEQLVDGPWPFVVMNGGANDLVRRCSCDGCDDIMDELVSADGTSGAIPELAASLRAQGSSVLTLGYYPMQADAEFGFDQCAATLQTLNDRVRNAAEGVDGFSFFDLGDVVQVSGVEAYDDDGVHPSAVGTRLIGEAIAGLVR